MHKFIDILCLVTLIIVFICVLFMCFYAIFFEHTKNSADKILINSADKVVIGKNCTRDIVEFGYICNSVDIIPIEVDKKK